MVPPTGGHPVFLVSSYDTTLCLLYYCNSKKLLIHRVAQKSLDTGGYMWSMACQVDFAPPYIPAFKRIFKCSELLGPTDWKNNRRRFEEACCHHIQCVLLLLHCNTLKMEALLSAETFATIYRSTRRNIPSSSIPLWKTQNATNTNCPGIIAQTFQLINSNTGALLCTMPHLSSWHPCKTRVLISHFIYRSFYFAHGNGATIDRNILSQWRPKTQW